MKLERISIRIEKAFAPSPQEGLVAMSWEHFDHYLKDPKVIKELSYQVVYTYQTSRNGEEFNAAVAKLFDLKDYEYDRLKFRISNDEGMRKTAMKLVSEKMIEFINQQFSQLDAVNKRPEKEKALRCPHCFNSHFEVVRVHSQMGQMGYRIIFYCRNCREETILEK